MEKRYQVIKPAHGYYKGECLDADIAPTIDTGVGCWHTLIGESMEEIKCEQVGMLSGDSWDKCHDTNRRVYSSNGLAPTITTMGGGQREPKIIEPTAYGEQNGYLRQDGCVGSLTTDGSSPKHNNRIVELNYELSSAMKRYINAKHDKYKVGDNNLVVNRDIACAKTTREGSTRADASDYITDDLPDNASVAGVDLLPYRIRKLTPRECFRLMGVKREDFERVAKNQSTSSLYHLAGDSIVATCLMAIFGELLSVDYQTKINELVEKLKQ